MKFKIGVIILSICLIFSPGFASANIVLSGKIYSSNFSEGIPNLEISAYCDGTNLVTITDSDGNYYFVFPNKICENYGVESPKNDSVVFLFKSSLDGSPTFDEINYYNLSVDFYWNDSKNYYFCGNDICDRGESNSTCYRDCSTEQVLPEGNLSLTGNVILDTFESGTSGWIILIVIFALSFLLFVFYSRERNQ